MSTSQEEVFEEVLPEPEAAGGSSAAPPSPAKPGPSGLAKTAGPTKKLSDSPKTIDGDTYYVIRPEGYNGEQSFSVKQCCGNELKIVIKPEHYAEVEMVANKKQSELDAVNKKCTALSKEKQAIKEKIKVSGNQICDAKERLREIKIQLLFKLARLATWQRKKDVEKEIRPNNTDQKENYLVLEKKLRDTEKMYREQSEKVMGLRDNIRSTIEEHVLLDSHAEDLKIENRRVRDQTRNNQIVLESLKQQNEELEAKCKVYWEKHSKTQEQVEELDVEAEKVARANDKIVEQNEKMAKIARQTFTSASKKVKKNGGVMPVMPSGPARKIAKKPGLPTPSASNLRRTPGMRRATGRGKPELKVPTKPDAKVPAKPGQKKGLAAGKRKASGTPAASAARVGAKKVSIADAAASAPTEAEIRAQREKEEFEYEEKMMAAEQAEEESAIEFAKIEYEEKMEAIRAAGARAKALLAKNGAAPAPMSRTKSDLMRRLKVIKEKEAGKVFTKEETDHIEKMRTLREAAAKAREAMEKDGVAPAPVSKTKSDLMKRLQALKDKQNK